MSFPDSHPIIERLNDFLDPDKNHTYGLLDLNSRAMLLAARQELERVHFNSGELHKLNEENIRIKEENERLRSRAEDLTQALISACKQPQATPYTFMPYLHPWKPGDITLIPPDTV
jgi:hypothetical protein